jgi:pentose-5-phosphate-3-epimerase
MTNQSRPDLGADGKIDATIARVAFAVGASVPVAGPAVLGGRERVTAGMKSLRQGLDFL